MAYEWISTATENGGRAGSLKEVERLFAELERPVDAQRAVAELARLADRLTSPRFRSAHGLPG